MRFKGFTQMGFNARTIALLAMVVVLSGCPEGSKPPVATTTLSAAITPDGTVNVSARFSEMSEGRTLDVISSSGFVHTPGGEVFVGGGLWKRPGADVNITIGAREVQQTDYWATWPYQLVYGRPVLVGYSPYVYGPTGYLVPIDLAYHPHVDWDLVPTVDVEIRLGDIQNAEFGPVPAIRWQFPGFSNQTGFHTESVGWGPLGAKLPIEDGFTDLEPVLPTDWDNDGIPDDVDPCPSDPENLCVDTDGDGQPDATDPCPTDPQDRCVDTDGDGNPDVTDPCPTDPLDLCIDTDGDGIPDSEDPCPLDPTNTCNDPEFPGDVVGPYNGNFNTYDAGGGNAPVRCDGSGFGWNDVGLILPPDSGVTEFKVQFQRLVDGVWTDYYHMTVEVGGRTTAVRGTNPKSPGRFRIEIGGTHTDWFSFGIVHQAGC